MLGQTQFVKCNANIPSDLAKAKLNSSNDYCSSPLHPPPFWCTQKKRVVGVERPFLYHAIAFERGVVSPAFSVLYSCSLKKPEPDGREAFHPTVIQPKHLPGNGRGLFTETKHRPALCYTITNDFSV